MTAPLALAGEPVWVVKDTADEYLVAFRCELYGEIDAKDWCVDQSFAFRWRDRNAAASVARKLSKRGARVVKLVPPKRSKT